VNGLNKILYYFNGINLLVENNSITKIKEEIILYVSDKIGQQVNDKAKYMKMSRNQNRK
jgi:hypothetical protein